MRFFSIFCGLFAVALHVQAGPTQAEIAEKTEQGLRLIRLGPDLDLVWKSDDEVLELIVNKTRFVRKLPLVLGSVFMLYRWILPKTTLRRGSSRVEHFGKPLHVSLRAHLASAPLMRSP